MAKKYAPRRASDLQPVIVHWRDAATQLDHEATMSDPDSEARFGGIMDVQDIGFLVRRTRKEIVLALGRCNSDDSIRHATTIPTSLVSKIDYLAVAGHSAPPKVEPLPPSNPALISYEEGVVVKPTKTEAK